LIHTVHLSKQTENGLTDIVMLQICLLSYALFTPSIGKDTCAAYLNRYKRFQNRGAAIARWVFDGRSPKRKELLQHFATSTSEDASVTRQERAEKRVWCRKLYRQVLALLFSIPIRLEILYDEDHASAWQKDAAAFLVSFYTYLGGDTPFPASLFSEPRAAAFGRQAFLQALTDANNDLYVCAVCDESGYYTIVEGNIRTDIDHYLPKSRYPHFACHPYNLIPICKACNQVVKGTKDPLEAPGGGRLSLHEIYLPYRSSGLSTSTYLGVAFEAAEKGVNWVSIGKLFPQQAGDQMVLQLIATLEEVYKVPHRWSQDGRVDKISETLFRRMRQFLGNGREGPLGFNMPTAIYNTLNQLLYYLHYEDQSKDPFAFAMTWMLAGLLNEEYSLLTQELTTEDATPRDAFRFPLIAELVEGLGQNAARNEERALLAKQLLDLIKSEQASGEQR
jgi:hypothetical protein